MKKLKIRLNEMRSCFTMITAIMRRVTTTEPTYSKQSLYQSKTLTKIIQFVTIILQILISKGVLKTVTHQVCKISLVYLHEYVKINGNRISSFESACNSKWRSSKKISNHKSRHTLISNLVSLRNG